MTEAARRRFGSFLQKEGQFDIVYQKAGLHNLFQLNVGTQDEVPVLEKDSFGWIPLRAVISPDGNRLAVHWNRERTGLWTISLIDHTERLIRSGEYFPFAWSADARSLYLCI